MKRRTVLLGVSASAFLVLASCAPQGLPPPGTRTEIPCNTANTPAQPCPVVLHVTGDCVIEDPPRVHVTKQNVHIRWEVPDPYTFAPRNGIDVHTAPPDEFKVVATGNGKQFMLLDKNSTHGQGAKYYKYTITLVGPHCKPLDPIVMND
jgi:hypothetical protein